jgi:hypothetical protein
VIEMGLEINCKMGKATWVAWLIPRVVNHEEGYYEVRITGRGSEFRGVIGVCSYGRYLCIPNWGIGCELADFTDVFWNCERLSRYVSYVDAITLAQAIAHLEEL